MRDLFIFGDLAGARTQDPLIKSEVLYQLSYQVGQKSAANILLLINQKINSQLFLINLS